MGHPPDYKCEQRDELTAQRCTRHIQPSEDHEVQVPDSCTSRGTLVATSVAQDDVAVSQQQAYSDDNKHGTDALLHNLVDGQCALLLGVYREQDDGRKYPSIQLPEYRDDRDSAIIHFGTIGTHEGKTIIPQTLRAQKRPWTIWHTPYGEDQDFYMLEVNLDGDQIDQLLQCSEIYDAGGECTNLCKRPQITCLPIFRSEERLSETR